MKEIVLVASGGLANRMRAVASGLTLSRDTGVPLSIVWYRDWGMNAIPSDLFADNEWMKKVTLPGYARYNLKWELPRKKNLYVSRLYQGLNFSEILVDDTEPMVSLRDNGEEMRDLVAKSSKSIYIYSGCPFYDFSVDFYRNLFTPVDDIKRRVDDITAGFGENMVGLHIRRTDNEMSRRFSPTSLFVNEVESLLKDNPGTMFYLASDDADTKRDLGERFSKNMIVSSLSSDRGKLDGIKDAWVELLVLSRCRLLLGSYWSSYSMSAPLLGDVELKQLKVEK